MILSLNSQLSLFLATVVLGASMGLVYDIFRVFRIVYKHPDIITQIEDILYWLMSSFIVFVYILNKNYGEIRFFAICGVFCGMIVYFSAVSRFLVKLFLMLIDYTKKTVSKAISIAMTPVRLLLNLLSGPLGFLRMLIIKLYKNTKKLLTNVIRYAKMKLNSFTRDVKTIKNKK